MIPTPPLADAGRHLADAVIALHEYAQKERDRLHPDDDAELAAIAAAITEIHRRVSELSQRMRRRGKD